MWPQLIAEFAGTFVIMAVALTHGDPVPVGIAVAACCYMANTVSLAHFNPAATVVYAFNNKMSSEMAMWYVAAQIVGAWAAFQFVKTVRQSQGVASS